MKGVKEKEDVEKKEEEDEEEWRNRRMSVTGHWYPMPHLSKWVHMRGDLGHLVTLGAVTMDNIWGLEWKDNI
jgi:hypothetical protein